MRQNGRHSCLHLPYSFRDSAFEYALDLVPAGERQQVAQFLRGQVVGQASRHDRLVLGWRRSMSLGWTWNTRPS